MSSITQPVANNNADLLVKNAKINITNLRLRTFIGFNPEEVKKQQDIVINAEIHYDATAAFASDQEQLALDYKVITKKMIKHVESGRFRLLEKLTADLLNIACEPGQVTKAEITVDKPHALRFADSVSVTLSGKKASG